jgi:hypothetical protein
MKRIATMATIGLAAGLVVGAVFFEGGPGLTSAQVLAAGAGALGGGLIGTRKHRIR